MKRNYRPDDASGDHGGLPEGLSPEEQQRQRALCKADILYWINEYGKTYDPRSKTPHLAFKLYPYQECLVKTMEEHIRNGEDILVEKSRDMGVSWLVLLVFQWFWLFEPGSDFLLGSRKLDYVDRLGDLSTLMEKLRYNLDKQPAWLLPEGYSRNQHSHFLKLVNPENGNVITGESSNPNFARGGRYKAVFMDEFAYWQNDDLAYASAGQSTPCRIVVSTPHGRRNKFAELRFDSPIHTERVHWSEHPNKTEAWYEKEKQRMTEDEIARELDINYHLSSRDRVFGEFTVKHKRDLTWNPYITMIRSWDFGHHCAAVLFLQIDPFGRLQVLHEVVCEKMPFLEFAQHVIDEGNRLFPGARYEDFADPAGNQRSDKSALTNLEMLGEIGIYPQTQVFKVYDGIELLRSALIDVIEELPGLIVHERCHITIMALEGGYRYRHGTDKILQEHPYEDVMDCLRYAACHKLDVLGRTQGKPHRTRKWDYRPNNPKTGY